MARVHKITFDQAGGIKVDATGYVGKACEEVTSKILAGLAADRSSDKKKNEYHMQETSDQQHSRW
jgi:hypothetical protein